MTKRKYVEGDYTDLMDAEILAAITAVQNMHSLYTSAVEQRPEQEEYVKKLAGTYLALLVSMIEELPIVLRTDVLEQNKAAKVFAEFGITDKTPKGSA